MSHEPGQGRGRNSPGPQRSPEELAALLATMADATGDPPPRAGGKSRHGILPPGFPPPGARRRPKGSALGTASRAAADTVPKPVNRTRKPSPEPPPPGRAPRVF